MGLHDGIDGKISVNKMIPKRTKAKNVITQLSRGDVMMDCKHVKRFFKVVNYVEHLSYGHGGGNWQNFDMDLLKATLQPLRPRLKSLGLSGPGYYHECYGNNLTYVPIDTRIGMLHDFTKLGHLTLGSHMIFGHDENLVDLDDVNASTLTFMMMLPLTLQSLKINIAHASVILHITRIS